MKYIDNIQQLRLDLVAALPGTEYQNRPVIDT